MFMTKMQLLSTKKSTFYLGNTVIPYKAMLPVFLNGMVV